MPDNPDAQRRTTLAGAGAGAPPPVPSPWRWLLVIVPLVVLAAGAAYLLRQGARSVQEFARETLPWISGTPRPRDTVPPARIPPRDVVSPAPPASGTEQARRPVDPRAVQWLLTKANPDDGARAFKMCSPCHTAEKNGPARVGPNLWGVAGRRMAADPRFNYSPALRAKDGTWGTAELTAYLHNSRAYVPGTSMAFAGIDDEMRIANLIAYLRTLSDGPGR